MPENANGRVKFSAVEINKSFICWLGNDGTKPTGGYGGWDIVNRPRRLSLTQWNGRDPISMEVHLLFDGYANNDPIEDDCKKLEDMAFNNGFDPPPIVNITGDTVQHQGLDWVITNITWGDKINRRLDGQRLRQEATVSIIRYVATDKVQLTAAQRARFKTPKPPKGKPKKPVHGIGPD